MTHNFSVGLRPSSRASVTSVDAPIRSREWNELYQRLLAETDVTNLPTLLAETRSAILDRLARHVVYDKLNIDLCERDPECQQLSQALKCLRILSQDYEHRLQRFGEQRESPFVSVAEGSLIMNGELKARWRELCEEIAVEENPAKFDHLFDEICLLLEQRQTELRHEKLGDSARPQCNQPIP